MDKAQLRAYPTVVDGGDTKGHFGRGELDEA